MGKRNPPSVLTPEDAYGSGFDPLPQPCKHRRNQLMRGMVIKTPEYLRSHWEDGKKVPIAEIWPDYDPFVAIELWDWEEGETEVVGPSGEGLDSNVLDYPKELDVLGFLFDMVDRNPSRTRHVARRLSNP